MTAVADLQSLPLPPAACKPLSDVDSRRLREKFPTLWSSPQKGCLSCQDTGTLRWADQTYRCDCRNQWMMHRWMLNAGVGLWHQRLSWQDVDTVPPAVLTELGAYLEGHKGNIRAGLGLVLWSPDRGTGKTLLAVLATKTLMGFGVDCYFVQFSEMIDTFTAGWRDEAERAWFNKRIRNATMLVIDDLGREHKGRSEVVESMLDQVIRHRVANALPTLLTTNYSPQEIQGGYGPNVMSLLYERSAWVEVAGRDYRTRSNERARTEIASGYSRPITTG